MSDDSAEVDEAGETTKNGRRWGGGGAQLTAARRN